MFRMLHVVLIAALVQSATAATLREIGSFSVHSPAFTNVYQNPRATDALDKFNLLISTFGVNLFNSHTDTVQIVKNVGRFMDNVASVKPEVLTSGVKWPNEIDAVPETVFSKEMLVIPDGFLVPTKTTGSIKLMDISNGQKHGPYTVTSTHEGDWFYHRVQWHDMDGDGDQDIVTCRAREPSLFGRHDEELIWLENPSGNYQTTWTTHVLAHGPDSFFRFMRLNTSEGLKDCIVAAQFFTKSLTVYWTTQANGLWTDATKVQKRVIDATIGSVFEIELVDLNNDGRKDFLVTTNGHNGTLQAFEVPDDFRTGMFVKHTLAVDFTPRSIGVGKGAPGSAFAIQPSSTHTNTKPVIILSGDDDGRGYMFEATTQSPTDWSYVKTTFCDVGKGTVGQISAADVNGDGYVDVFVPSYNTNHVLVFTFAPSGGVVVG